MAAVVIARIATASSGMPDGATRLADIEARCVALAADLGHHLVCFQSNAEHELIDRIQQAGGYISVNTSGNTVDANAIPIEKDAADEAFNAAACIGCGACVAACKNASAMLFVSAKAAHLNLLPQGQAERYKRAEAMVETMDEHFGSCTNHGECEAACPKEISIDNIAIMNQDYRKSKVKNRRRLARL